MSWTVRIAVVVASAALLGTAAPAGAQGSVTLRYGEWLPPTYFMNQKFFGGWFEDVKKVTEGRVTIQPTAAPLGPPPRNYQLAVDGVADVIWIVHGFTPGTFPLSGMVELPFLTKSAEANSVAYWRVYKKHFEPASMHKGVHTLAIHVHPPGHLYTTGKPIRSVDDLKGMKIRNANSTVADILKTFGVVPIGAPVTEVREILSRGIADGVTFTDEALYNFRISQFIKQSTKFPGGLYTASFAVVMNQKRWNSLQKADQDAIMKISGEAMARRMGRVWQDEEDGAAGRLPKDGIHSEQASGAFLAEVRDRLKEREAMWIAEARKHGVDGKAALEMYQRERDSK